MARGNMNPQPWVKHIEVYNSFSGGLNTTSDFTKMKDTEVAELTNMDITPRGTLQRRAGMVIHQRSLLWSDLKGETWASLNGVE